MKHFYLESSNSVSGVLAVNKCLGFRHFSPDKVCTICNSSEETVVHALFHCPWIKVFCDSTPFMHFVE